MDATVKVPQRFISPPADLTAPRRRSLPKTTVTSANLASVGESNLATSVGNIVAHEKLAPLSDSTPRRRPSFIETVQQPTPRGSLQWPSTHRSFSSATATRDSSRHSQATDRVSTAGGLGLGGIAGGRGRAPSSTCRTPMSSCDDRSDHRYSAISGAGGPTRRNRSVGPHPSAPPLVDLSGDSPLQEIQSASHSVYTTGLCTPRDNAGGAAGYGRHHSPARGPSISATISVGARNAATPAPPPLDDFEAEAQTLSRAELEERVEQMRGDNLVLRTSVLRLRESLAMLQEGLRANYADIERRQDSIANMLLRRLEITKRHRAKLVAHLRKVELEKASQEAKLQNTKQDIRDLTKHLKQEEQEIAERLQRRLEKLHDQREQLEKALAEQTNSLQQLERLVQEVEEMGLGDGVGGSANQNTTTTGLGTNSSIPPSADASIHESADTSAQGNTEAPAPTPAAAATPAIRPASASAPAAAAQPLAQVGHGASAIAVHERSSSRVSVASSAAGTAATTADVAYDPNAMIRYLAEEIVAAESLRADALSKAEQYVATRERLERRLKWEKEHKAEQATRTEALRQELRSANSAVSEKMALQEMAMEMEVDRHLNSSRFGGDIISSASSTCATPKLRATSAMMSRGNSISPCTGGLTARSGTCDADTRSGPMQPPPTDNFLLPSSSFNSTAPASSLAAGHPPVATAAASCPTGMLVGDGGTVPRMSSSSIRISTSISRDETTASSEGTPHTSRLLVQDTSRMAAPRPITSTESTPRRTPLATPQLSVSQAPVA